MFASSAGGTATGIVVGIIVIVLVVLVLSRSVRLVQQDSWAS